MSAHGMSGNGFTKSTGVGQVGSTDGSDREAVLRRFLPACSNFVEVASRITDLGLTNLEWSDLRWNDHRTTFNCRLNGKYLLGVHDLNRPGYQNLAVHHFGLTGLDANGVPNNPDAILTSANSAYLGKLTNAALYPVLLEFEAGKGVAGSLLKAMGFDPALYRLVPGESRQEQVSTYRLPFHRYVYRNESASHGTSNLMTDDEVVIGLSAGSPRGVLCYFEQTAYVVRSQR